MKKLLSLALVCLIVLSMNSIVLAKGSLTDIEDTKYESAVKALEVLNIVDGYEDGEYKANKLVTRAEMAKLLVIATGKDNTAKISLNASTFNDVAANHWALGYINVASQCGFINGYPDGSFKPDETINYAEAATMALRALGYDIALEGRGTWPTNYLGKAQELEIFDGVDFDTYLDGVTRGNTAIFMWNMLRTNIWDVNGQSENDGLNYSVSELTMINKYFKDYAYDDEAIFEDFEIVKEDDEDVVVNVELKGELKGTYTYDENDFYTFVKGTEVEVLVNKEDKAILLMSANDKIIAGESGDFEDYKNFDKNAEFDYAYARISGKTIKEIRELDIADDFIKEVKKTSKQFTAKGNKNYKFDEDFESIIILDGERIDPTDIKENDVLSVVEIDNGEVFYIVSREKVVGDFDNIIAKKDVTYIEVDGDRYEIEIDKVIELVDDEDEAFALETILNDEDNEFYGEEVTVYFNFLGEIIRVEFEEIETTDVFGLIDEDSYKKTKNGEYLEVDGVEYKIINSKTSVKDYEGTAIIGKKTVSGLEIVKSYASGELAQAGIIEEVENDGRRVTVSGDAEKLNLNKVDLNKDSKVFMVYFDAEEEVFDSWKEVDIDTLKLKVNDRIATLPAGLTVATIEDADYILIIREK